MSDIGSMVFRTGFGWAGAVMSPAGIRAVVLPKRSRHAVLRELRTIGEENGMPASCLADRKRARDLLLAFFAGRRRVIPLACDLRGHSLFRRSVWTAAMKIPYGETRSYGWIARRIGRPGAARAVGQAMGANPVPILVP